MKSIKLLFIVLILFFSRIPASIGQNEVDLGALEKYFEQAMQDWNVPGMAIAIVKDGEIVLAKGFGVKEVGEKSKVDENTLFPIASITKSFTSAAIATLVDEGKINWDDRVVDYLPYFELYDPYVTQEMRVRDLLSHRSGLETFSGDLLWYGANYSREEVIRRVRYLKPAYGFRSHYGYSNIMYIAAGEIVGKVSGSLWDDYIKETFFKPLKMEHSITSINDLSKSSNMVMPHVEKDGKLIPIPYLNWDNIGGAGAINSNVVEMSQWIKLQLNEGKFDGQEIISTTQFLEMQRPHIFLEPNNKTLWPSMHFKAYGLGWEMFDYHGRKVLGHSGGYDGVISYLGLVPEEKLGFIILTNKTSALYYPLFYKILDVYFGVDEKDWSATILKFVNASEKRNEEQKKLDEERRVPNTKPTHEMEDFAGLYRSKIYGDAKVFMSGDQLKIQLLPSEIFEGTLTHWHYNTFEIEMLKAPSLPKGKVNFTLNAEGAIEKFVIDIPNPDFDFTEFTFYKVND